MGVPVKIATWHRPLLLLAAGSSALLLISLVWLVVVHRVLIGVQIWLKSVKFGLSISLYALTGAWLMTYLPGRAQGRAGAVVWWSATVVAVMLWLEYLIIAGQIVRGRRSHFNFSTGLDTAL